MLFAEELTERVIGLAIEVHRQTGPGFLESVYEGCLCYELRHAGIDFKRQVGIPIIYKGIRVGEGFRADVLVAGQVVLEIKAVATIIRAHEAVLHKTRWCVLKRKAILIRMQRFRLRDRLRYNLRTVRAYPLKEDFQQFWDYTSPAWAAKFLDDWCQQVMRLRIEPMKKAAKTLRGHRELILNYFRAKKQLSSGGGEGLNSKANVTMRKSYGFRTFHVTETALYHTLGKLPEPSTAHRFY